MATIVSEGATLSLAGAIVGQLTSLSINHSRDTIDVSNLSTTGAKDFIASTLYESEISCEVQLENYASTGTGQDAAATAFDGAGSTAVVAWIIDIGDSTTGMKFNGNGFVTGFDVSVGLDSVVTASITIKVDGNVTAAAAAD